jgi:hypothetical protein
MVAPATVSVAMHPDGVIVLAIMRRVIVVLFFTIAFACQSVSFKLDVDGAQFITIASQGGFVLGEFTDCDDDYRHPHAAPILVTVEGSPLFTRFVGLPECSSAPRFDEIKTPLSKLHAVLRI